MYSCSPGWSAPVFDIQGDTTNPRGVTIARHRLRRWLWLAFLSIASAANGQASSTRAEDFILPGVDFSKVTLREGAWCRYVVADEALGQTDSTEVYVGVPAREKTARGTAYWVEIASRPLRGVPDDIEVLKFLVLEGITAYSEGDSLGRYVLEMYNRVGSSPPRQEDPKRYKRFSMVVATQDSLWLETPESVATIAGRFACSRKERTVDSVKEIPTGKVKIIKKARDHFVVWLNPEVPVFHLVRCVIERARETRTEPRVPGIPTDGPRETRTTAELTAFGSNAKAILPLEAVRQ